MPTPKFKWKDRDSAAQDLLQLVYDVPPLSSRTLRLLRSIRSPIIVPQLKAIVLDENRDIMERRYALQAIISVSFEVDMPQLAQYMENAFEIRCNKFRKIPPHRPYYSDFSSDLLDEIMHLAVKHPSNQKWLFEVLNRVQEPVVASDYLSKMINHKPTNDFHQQLFDKLLKLIEYSPDVLNLNMVEQLWHFKADRTRESLSSHLERILELCLSSPREHRWIRLADKWDELCDKLIKVKPEYAALIADYRQWEEKYQEEKQLREQRSLLLAQESQAYQLLLRLYGLAQNDDEAAYDKLTEIAKKEENISLRATATHFIGELLPKYDSLAVLQYLLKHAHADHLDQAPHDSPIQFEAGEALLRYPSPNLWETLVDDFIDSTKVLSPFSETWITQLTDVLNGESHEYKGNYWRGIENHFWFYSLNEIDEKVIERYT